MAYFNFENGKTALNDTNLNAMQTAIEEDITETKTSIENDIAKKEQILKGTILFDSAIGENGTITLNESVDNFEYIEIFFSKDQGYMLNIKVCDTSKRIPLTTVYAGDNGLQIQCKVIGISNTTVSHIETEGINFGVGDPNVHVFNNDGTQIFIHRIVGYK